MGFRLLQRTHAARMKDQFAAILEERKLLTTPERPEDPTYHMVLRSCEGVVAPFAPGDSVAIYAENDPAMVEALLRQLGASKEQLLLHPKTGLSLPLGEFLLKEANLTQASSKLLDWATPLLGEERSALAELEPLEILARAPSIDAALFCRLLSPLLPRYYSIASSPLVHPDELHLTVTLSRYQKEGELRMGVASGFLCDRAPLGSRLRCFIQPSRHFALPETGDTPIIMVGPGTGVAPFRAFLQHRIATGATGPNWLFFGEKYEAHQFYYRPFLEQLVSQGQLRLHTAFSRDTAKKIYVQHRMWEERNELYRWLQQGAPLYICGDATHMAKDVTATLLALLESEGSLTPEAARQRLAQMRKEKQLRLDVY